MASDVHSTSLNSIGFDHIGVAVRSIEQSRPIYEALRLGPPHIEEVPSEQVRVCMYTLGGDLRLELIEPTASTSSVAQFLERRGPGLHHICFRVHDVKAELKRLKQKGFRLVHDQPFRGAHGCQVAFVHPKATGGVLIELSQRTG